MAEQIFLDPTEVLSTRSTFELTPWVSQDGIEWGDATIEAVMAEGEWGAVPVDYTVPNREITVPLRLGVNRGGTTPDTARTYLQAKVALLQREGGSLKRITNSGSTVFADVVDATLAVSSVSGWESARGIDVDAEMTLTCLPDFYGAEVTLSDHTETTAAELVFTETGIDGDYPARVRVVVDDDQAQDQHGLIFGFRSRHYSSASTAALKYEAEASGPLDTAVRAALSGASGGTVITHGTLTTNWTPVCGTTLTHTGTYHLWGRVYSTSGTTVQARAVWDVGDLVNPVTNDAWRVPGGTAFYTHDFGEVRLDPPPVGTHRWQLQLQAKGDAGAENFSVDKIWLAPVDEGYGVLVAPFTIGQGLATYSARSEFSTESGVITGDSLAVGGTWGGAGDADDFSVAAGVATRTALNDTGGALSLGRVITASATTAMTTCVAKVDFKRSVNTASGGLIQGVIARYTDVNNFFAVYVAPSSGASVTLVALKRVASTETTLTSLAASVGDSMSYRTIQVFVDTLGRWSIWLVAQGGALGTALAGGQDSALATGGTLASGKVGILDYYVTGTGPSDTRTYDNFQAWAPTGDAVTFASQSCQLTTDGHFREDSTGTAYGPVSVQTGDLPRLPVAGIEARTTEVFLKSSRGDFDTVPDSHTSTDSGDDISARITYRPCWLHVPEA